MVPPTDTALRRRLEVQIDQLPVLPLALANLLALDPNGDLYFEDVVRILEAEPNFSARVLRAANSAESAPAQPLATLSGAVARLGSRGATNLVLALSVTKVFVPRDPWEQSLWRHGVQVAHAARALAGYVDDDQIHPEEVYACALLHDLGRFILFQEDPDRLRAVDEGDWDTPAALIEVERQICGLTHTELGAMACKKWRLPDVITQVVGRHHDPLPAQFSNPIDKVVAIVRLADLAMFPSAVPGSEGLGQRLDPDALGEYLQPRMPPFLTVPELRLRHLILQAASDADAACQVLGIGGS